MLRNYSSDFKDSILISLLLGTLWFMIFLIKNSYVTVLSNYLRFKIYTVHIQNLMGLTVLRNYSSDFKDSILISLLLGTLWFMIFLIKNSYVTVLSNYLGFKYRLFIFKTIVCCNSCTIYYVVTLWCNCFW